MNDSCIYRGCEATAKTEPIHRLSPKGQEFEGACAAHWWDLATPSQQAAQRARHRALDGEAAR